MYLHKFIPRVFFSFQYFWLHGKEEEEEKPWKEVGIVM